MGGGGGVDVVVLGVGCAGMRVRCFLGGVCVENAGYVDGA